VQPWPEVISGDQVATKRFHEAFGPFLHVQRFEPPELSGHFAGRMVELTVKVVRLGRADNSTTARLALGAAKLDLPGTPTEIVDLDGVHQSRVA
jgi:hypothetical protein